MYDVTLNYNDIKKAVDEADKKKCDTVVLHALYGHSTADSEPRQIGVAIKLNAEKPGLGSFRLDMSSFPRLLNAHAIMQEHIEKYHKPTKKLPDTCRECCAILAKESVKEAIKFNKETKEV